MGTQYGGFCPPPGSEMEGSEMEYDDDNQSQFGDTGYSQQHMHLQQHMHMNRGHHNGMGMAMENQQFQSEKERHTAMRRPVFLERCHSCIYGYLK